MSEWGSVLVALGAVLAACGALIKAFDPAQKHGGFALRWGFASIAIGTLLVGWPYLKPLLEAP